MTSICVTVVVTALGLMIAVLGLATGAATFGLAPVVAGQVTLLTVGDLLVAWAASTLLALLPLAGVVVLAWCLSAMLRSAQAALTVALAACCVLWVAGLLPAIGGWVFLGTYDWPFAVALSRSEGLKTEAFTDGLLPHLGVNLLWIAGLVGLALTRFLRRDLTR